MLNNLTSFQQRTLTGLALISLVMFVSWTGSFFMMWLFLGTFCLFSFHEAMQLFKVSSSSAYLWATLLWIMAYFYPSANLFFLIAIIFASSLAYFHNFDKRLILPFLYPFSGMLFVLALYAQYGLKALLWLLVCVAITDIGAYFTGKAIGKTKFSDTSPNKTLEGVFGGIILATLLGTYIGMFTAPFWTAFIVTFITAIASVFGDLFESYLKREAGVKDSGNILPGHGGILDRIDGYLFAAPILFIALHTFL
ncbi:MAG: phosphatidate cytidylyltransferase [Sulfurovum sp.]|nr:phosphatidate cytidylyltransferase [Sulfurovum sp.]